MSGIAGVELTPRVVRVVRLAPITRRVTAAIEIPWDPTKPDVAVAQLAERIGRPASVSLAIGLGFLHVIRVDLPPVAPDERARMVQLEPDRYFAAGRREDLVTTVAADGPFAFAVSNELVESWIAAFDGWAPVDWVEPAPVAVARALVGAGSRDGTWSLAAGEGESGTLALARGLLAGVRRTQSGAGPENIRAVPALGGLPGSFSAALGAARPKRHQGGSVAIAPDRWRRRFTSRHATALVTAAAIAVAGIALVTWSADRWRGRTLAALEARASEMEVRAAAADSALRVLRSREAEGATIRELLAVRPDPFRALAVISAALPRDANLLSARASGNNWQIDGTTGNAAALVPILDRNESLDSVRFLSASSRFRDASRTYETFSIAFHFRPRP